MAEFGDVQVQAKRDVQRFIPPGRVRGDARAEELDYAEGGPAHDQSGGDTEGATVTGDTLALEDGIESIRHLAGESGHRASAQVRSQIGLSRNRHFDPPN